MVKLTKRQEEALKIATERYNNKEKFTVIAGFAGTGKTFITKLILEKLGLQEKDYLVGAFTGKASFKLQQSGFPHAKTLHKIRYRSFKIEDEWCHMRLPLEKYAGIKVILIDEVSMVPKRIWMHMLELGIHIIALGDPGQLPPVGADNGVLRRPHIFLNEIMRQKGENSIVTLSHQVRNGEMIKPFCDKNVKIITMDELDGKELLSVDQIICGRNDTRRKLNQNVRNQLGRKFRKPEIGDKMIALNNNWNIHNENGMPIINGLLGTVKDVGGVYEELEKQGEAIGEDVRIAPMKFTPETKDGDFAIDYDTIPFYGDGKKESFQIDPDRRFMKVDYGYAITTHKSQGSEYSRVLGFEETLTKAFHRRWLYTLITRAVDEIIIVKSPDSTVFL